MAFSFYLFSRCSNTAMPGDSRYRGRRNRTQRSMRSN
nr:MAG TPA: hypothetical protein [Bacteriophage sp.]